MADAGDFSSPLSVPLLADRTPDAPPEIGRLRAAREKAWLELSAELSVPVEGLAELSFVEWSALSARVVRAGPPIPEVADAGLPHVGLEFEYAPLSGDRERALEDTKAALKEKSPAPEAGTDRDGDGDEGEAPEETEAAPEESGPLDASIDQSCVELRTGEGGVPLDLATLASVCGSARRAEAACPGWLATMHVHVDADALPPEDGERVFAESRDQTRGHGTTEVRSLPPPTLTVDDGRERRGRKHRLDPVRAGWLALFASRAAEVPEDGGTGGDFDGLGPADAVRKALTLSLMGESPQQRAAAIYAVRTSPMFVDCGLAVRAVRSRIPEGRMGDAYSGLLEIGYEKKRETIVQAIAEYGGEECVRLLMGRAWGSADAGTRETILRSVAEHGGEAGARLLVGRFDGVWDSADAYTRKTIARFVKEHHGEEGARLLRDKDLDPDSDDNSAVSNRRLGRRGARKRRGR
ncbi:MAG: hypothetical protein AUJ19_01835 [Parcubacteria group bacterium CG1_02_58_44]|nr:MAG: hypothetical protein AUJ19_01835 [Parcubacteria group bacterium CG1_02_58_44]